MVSRPGHGPNGWVVYTQGQQPKETLGGPNPNPNPNPNPTPTLTRTLTLSLTLSPNPNPNPTGAAADESGSRPSSER